MKIQKINTHCIHRSFTRKTTTISTKQTTSLTTGISHTTEIERNVTFSPHLQRKNATVITILSSVSIFFFAPNNCFQNNETCQKSFFKKVEEEITYGR